MDPLLRYGEKEDATFFLCPLCQKESQISGTHEYGFYMKCSCGFTKEIVSQTGKDRYRNQQ